MLMQRTPMLIAEAAGWVAISLLLGLGINKLTDSSAPGQVLIPVGLIMALGTIVEIWFPVPLTGRRHPKVPQGPQAPS